MNSPKPQASCTTQLTCPNAGLIRFVLGFTLLLLFGLQACVMPEKREQADINIDLKDQTYRKIIDFQDRQLTDSLLPYFQEEDPVYRYGAAMAFGSIKDEAAVDALGELLDDGAEEVAIAAAYAIGQIGDASGEKYLIRAFDRYDTVGISDNYNRAILEAVGKCGTEESLEAMSSIKTYQPKDTALLEGQAWSIYRFALRQMTTDAGTKLMLQYASNKAYPEQVRFIAANYLARAQGITLDSLSSPLVEAIGKENVPEIRMAMAIALGKTKGEKALNALISQFNNDKDHRVKTNILRAFSNFAYKDVQGSILKALKDKNLQIASRAAQYFIEKGIPQDATFYWRTAKEELPWQIQMALYEAANRHLPAYAVDTRDIINYELRQRFVNSELPYEKAQALKGLAEFGWNFRYIQREGFVAQNPTIRTASVEALAAISDNRIYQRYFGAINRSVSRELATYYQQAIQSSDPAMIAVAADALKNPDRDFKQFLPDLTFLNEALEQLNLPKEMETYYVLKETIDYFKGVETEDRGKPAFNHPIDWTVWDKYTETPKVMLQTQRGNIKLELLPTIAPGTVINFLKLCEDGFYNGKNFHRVVPNFVIQGGCPRGDGYGSLDYTIRSELPLIKYDAEGYVGMASAGNHTECTQFFITHSPTPHLDGNYTIFAKVTDGMEVVNEIQIGDLIHKAVIQE